MSIAQDVYMGVEETDTGSPHRCNMHAGIVFSSVSPIATRRRKENTQIAKPYSLDTFLRA